MNNRQRPLIVNAFLDNDSTSFVRQIAVDENFRPRMVYDVLPSMHMASSQKIEQGDLVVRVRTGLGNKPRLEDVVFKRQDQVIHRGVNTEFSELVWFALPQELRDWIMLSPDDMKNRRLPKGPWYLHGSMPVMAMQRYALAWKNFFMADLDWISQIATNCLVRSDLEEALHNKVPLTGDVIAIPSESDILVQHRNNSSTVEKLYDKSTYRVPNTAIAVIVVSYSRLPDSENGVTWKIFYRGKANEDHQRRQDGRKPVGKADSVRSNRTPSNGGERKPSQHQAKPGRERSGSESRGRRPRGDVRPSESQNMRHVHLSNPVDPSPREEAVIDAARNQAPNEGEVVGAGPESHAQGN